jgi:ubiquinone/menaquinone biosynthesis C-methylase UbiE
MEDNPQLTCYEIHDLNKNYHLPFRDEEFDAVICSFSVDYMTQPFGVFEDVARILKQQGYFIVTFSNRWFPPKVAKIWSELHEFERIGLVLEYFLQSGQYKDLETYSLRGLPRPMDDKYYPQIQFSDPIYAVWGAKA